MKRRITITITDETTEETEAAPPENIFEQAEREEQQSHRKAADLWQEAARSSG